MCYCSDDPGRWLVYQVSRPLGGRPPECLSSWLVRRWGSHRTPDGPIMTRNQEYVGSTRENVEPEGIMKRLRQQLSIDSWGGVAWRLPFSSK